MGGRWIAEWRLEEPSSGESAQLITADSKPFLDQLYSFYWKRFFLGVVAKQIFVVVGTLLNSSRPSHLSYSFLVSCFFLKEEQFSSEKMIFWQRLIPVISRILSVQQLS